MSAKMSPFDLAKNINSHGERLVAAEVDYNPYMVNAIYGNTPDTVLFANEMNQHWGSLTKQMQYDFYRFGLTKNMRRFGTWNKRKEDNGDDIAQIMEAYGYSRAKALEVYVILKPHMEQVRARNDKGGKAK